MKHGMRNGWCLLVLAVWFVVAAGWTTRAVAQAPDIVLRVQRLEQLLGVVDQIAGGAAGGVTPSFMLRGMLQGTDWIDPARSIVLGVDPAQQPPVAALLIPFSRPNEAFQQAMGAAAGPDYYLLSLPPGRGAAPAPVLETALAQLARTPASRAVQLDIGLGRVLQSARGQIDQAMNTIRLPATPGSQPPGTPSAEDLRGIAQRMVELGRDVERLTLGLDLTAEKVIMVTRIQARPETGLAALLKRPVSNGSLGMPGADYAIRFRSGPYDLVGMMDLFNLLFGPLYQSMGLDLTAMTGIVDRFSGETAGAVDLMAKGIHYETAAVLADGVNAETFLESDYLPWLEAYGDSLGTLIQRQTGQQVTDPITRTQDSQVAGRPVFGVKMRFPMAPGQELAETEMRLAVAGRHLLMASDDARLEALMNALADGSVAAPPPADAPWMAMELDWEPYLAGLASFMPGGAGLSVPAGLGAMRVTATLGDGEGEMETAFDVADMAKLADFFKRLGELQAALQTSAPEPAAIPEIDAAAPPSAPAAATSTSAAPEAPPEEKGVRYWVEKGSVCAVYGNNEGAVRYFRKALELDPARSDVHFQLGVALGEMEAYTGAVAAINRALELSGHQPHRRALYLYGRGRVLLKAGDTDAALSDIRAAADLGNRDAREYLAMHTEAP